MSWKPTCGHCLHGLPTPAALSLPPGGRVGLCCLCGVTKRTTQERLEKDRAWHDESFKKRAAHP